MKTKGLFYSVAIAAALASCSQEAIEVVDNKVQQDLSIRPTLGEIVLVENTEVTSRFAVGGGAQPVFSEGDKLGAAIMDKPLYSGIHQYNDAFPAANYEIVNYYSSNSAFTYDGNAWYLNEDQPLVEGNYMFYAPYNAAMQFRSAFDVAVPAKQDASTEKSALDEFYASGAVVRVGAQFLAAEGGKAQKPKVTMNDVFAYPMFTIKNNFEGYLNPLNPAGQAAAHNQATAALKTYSGTLVVDSIQFVLKDANSKGDVALKGKLSNAGAAAVMSGKWATTPFENYTAELLDDNKTIADAGKVITTLVAGGREIKKGESAVFYAVMPAARYDENNLSANIFVTIDEKPYVFKKGEFSRTGAGTETSPYKYSMANSSDYLHYKTTANGYVTLIKGQRYPQEELNFEDGKLSSKTKIAGNALTLDIKGGTYTTTGTAKVIEYLQEVKVEDNNNGGSGGGTTETELIDNNAELIAFFKDLENGTNYEEGKKYPDDTTGDLFDFSDDNTVVINSELIEALSTYNHKGSMSITSVFPIADDVTVAYKKNSVVTFTSNNGVSYDITLGNDYKVTENAIVGKSVHVIKSWNADNTIYENVIVYEGAVATIGNIQFEAASFVNNGTLNVNNSNVINAVTNNGIIYVIAPENLIVNAGNGEIIASAASHTTETALAKLNNVYVTGGTQVGTYDATSASNVTNAVADAEVFSWISDFKYNGSLAFSQEILDEVEDITTFHITGASFPGKTLDMAGLTLCMEGTSSMTISGVHKSQSIVNNVNIYNATGEQINLVTIAANGTYNKVENGGEIYANGTTATWNNASVGVNATEYLVAALRDKLSEIVLPSNIALTSPLALTEGQTLNGNGKTLKSNVNRMITIKYGKIENLVIDGENSTTANGCKRGIFNDDNRTTGTLEINNVTIQGVGYALNLYGNEGSSFVVKNSTLKGWTSFTGYASSSFENCHFGNGAYFNTTPDDGNLKPHNDVILTNCTFDNGFCLDFEMNPSITLINCKVNGVLITAENIRDLLGSANNNEELSKVKFN